MQAYLKNNTADEEIKFQLFPIKGCDVLCPLDTFLSLTKDLIVTNYPVECKSKSRFSVYIKINRICFKFLAPKSVIFLIDSKKILI